MDNACDGVIDAGIMIGSGNRRIEVLLKKAQEEGKLISVSEYVRQKKAAR